MLVLQGCTASYLYLDDAVFYSCVFVFYTLQLQQNEGFQPYVIYRFFFLFLFITKCNNWSTTIALSKTVRKPTCRLNTSTNPSMHRLVNVNQHVDSTHNQHVNVSVSKRKPTCRFNTPTNC